MFTIINNIKNELYSNNKINWFGVLFFFSEPLSLLAAYFLLQRGLNSLNNPSTFLISTFFAVIFTTIGYILRIPYMWDKPSALFFLILNVIIWLLVLGTWIYAYINYNKYKKKNKKDN